MLCDIDGVEVVGKACHGWEASQMIRQLDPDEVILDIRMPERNGYEVLRDMRQEWNNAVVIILTSYPYEQFRTACELADSDYFFDKSCEFEKVSELCSKMACDQSNQSIVL